MSKRDSSGYIAWCVQNKVAPSEESKKKYLALAEGAGDKGDGTRQRTILQVVAYNSDGERVGETSCENVQKSRDAAAFTLMCAHENVKQVVFLLPQEEGVTYSVLTENGVITGLPVQSVLTF